MKHLLMQLILKRFSGASMAELQNPGMDLTEIGYGTYGSQHLIIHRWNSLNRLKIGKYCSIADSIHIFLGGNHDISAVSTYPFGTDAEELIGPREGHPKSNGDINIGNDVWIASNVSIMSGIKIGDGAVIAAFSHVVKDVKPYEVVGGNPAKHISFRVPEEDIEELIKIAWWDWPKKKILSNRELLVSAYSKDTIGQLRSTHN